MTRRQTRFTPTLALALLASVVFDAGPASAAGLVGRKAPEITLPHGGMFGVTPRTKLSDYRGDVVLVVFWSTRCPRCRRHMALVQRLHARYKDKGLKTLAVASSTHGQLRTYMRGNRYDFGVGADPQSVNLAHYGVRHYPATFLVGRDGRVKDSRGKLYLAIERELEAKK